VAFGILLTYDGERFNHAALHSIPPAALDFMRDPAGIRRERNPVDPRLASGLVHIIDIIDNELTERATESLRYSRLAGASRIALPLCCPRG